METAHPPPPQQLQQRYEATALQQGVPFPRRLGTGGFGSVWLYRRISTHELVAIKSMPLTQLTVRHARDLQHHLPRELSIHYRLNHPLVVDLLDVFMENQVVYIVMEFIPGGNLYERIRHAPQNEGQARWFFQQLVVTLDYLHAKNVSHRDVKLENTLWKPVLGYPQTPRIKVADFGLSRSGDAGVTAVGTPEYKAPEILALPPPPPGQQQQHEVVYAAPSTDVWSSGVMLYIMLAHQYPFQGIPGGATNAERLALMHEGALHARIAAMNVTPGAQHLLQQMLRFNPDQRIGIEGVIAHPWFQQDLDPAMLQLGQQQLGVLSPAAGLVTPGQLQGVIDNALQLLNQLYGPLPEGWPANQ